MPAFDASLTLNAATQKAAAGIATDFSIEVVRFLAAQHGFDADEAIRLLGFDNLSVKPVTKKQKREKSPKAEKPKRDLPKVLLPWTGQAVEGWCPGLRLNHGLHTQCTQEADPNSSFMFCKTCQRQADKNESGKPTYGTTEDRLATGVLDFKDPKTGKLTVPYANVMEKLGIDKQTAISEADRFGLTIPEEHFVARKSKRGRPAKVATSDSDDESAPKKPKGKRGRPAKAKKMIESSTGDDLINELLNQAQTAANSTDSDGSDAETPKSKTKKTKTKKTKNATSDAENSDAETTEITDPPDEEQKNSKAKKPKMTDEEKAAKKAEKLEAKREAKRLEKAAKKAADLEAKKAVELEAKKAAELEAEEYTAETEDEDDEPVSEVRKFEYDGKTYLKDDSNVLYDPATQDPVGIWNATTETIDDYVEDDEDEDEE